MTDFNSSNNDNGNGNNGMFDRATASGKGLNYIGGGNSADAARARIQDRMAPKPTETVSEIDLRPVTTQIGGTQTSVTMNSRPQFAAEPVFTGPGGFPISDMSKVSSQTTVTIGKHSLSVGAAKHLGMLVEHGPGQFSISDSAYDQMAQDLERGEVPGRVVQADLSQGADTQLVDALNHATKGRLDAILMTAIDSQMRTGEYSYEISQELQRAVPDAKPEKLEAALSSYVSTLYTNACELVSHEEGGRFSPAQIAATLESKSPRAKSLFLRACVGRSPQTVMQIWSSLKMGALS